VLLADLSSVTPRMTVIGHGLRPCMDGMAHADHIWPSLAPMCIKNIIVVRKPKEIFESFVLAKFFNGPVES